MSGPSELAREARVRRAQVTAVLAVVSGLLSVLLAVVVNVATGGSLPAPLAGVSWLAWPAVGLLTAAAIGLALWQQRFDGAPRTKPQTGPLPRLAELPPPRDGFAGREADLDALGRVIDGGAGLVAVVGPPGTGKTSLALRLAHDRRAGYPDGQLFAALRGASGDPVAPRTVLSRFLTALGVAEEERRGSTEDLAARLRAELAHRAVLILLDDARDAAQVRPLLGGGPRCLVLVTSRRMVAELPDCVPHLLSGLEPADGLALLARAAGEDRIAADRAGSARLVELCGGYPLALWIAGARLRARPAWTPSDLAARMADEERRLVELTIGDRAIGTVFEASYRELSAPDRQAFRRAGSHPGLVFGVGAAAALAELAEPAAEAAMERLVDAQLVESPAAGRYKLHDLLRLFATDRLTADEPPGARAAALARLLGWFGTRAADWPADELDNVVATVTEGVRAGAYQAVWDAVEAVNATLTKSGDHPVRLALWQEAERAAAALGDRRRQALALCRVASARRNAGEASAALRPAEQAVAIADELGEPVPLAEALYEHGEVLRDLNRLAESERVLTRSLELVAAQGVTDREIDVRNALATLYNMRWEPERAIPVLERAQALLPAEESHQHAWTLNELGTAYRSSGRLAEAAALNTRVLALAERIGDDFVHGYALAERGWLANDTGRYDDAVRDLTAARAVFERIRHATGVALMNEAIGVVATEHEHYGEALVALDAAIAQFGRLHDPITTGRSRLFRARALARSGRSAEARAELRAADELAGDAALPGYARERQRLEELLGPA